MPESRQQIEDHASYMYRSPSPFAGKQYAINVAPKVTDCHDSMRSCVTRSLLSPDMALCVHSVVLAWYRCSVTVLLPVYSYTHSSSHRLGAYRGRAVLQGCMLLPGIVVNSMLFGE